MASLTIMPPEIQLNILKDLCPLCAYSLSLTCKALRHLADWPLLWSSKQKAGNPHDSGHVLSETHPTRRCFGIIESVHSSRDFFFELRKQPTDHPSRIDRNEHSERINLFRYFSRERYGGPISSAKGLVQTHVDASLSEKLRGGPTSAFKCTDHVELAIEVFTRYFMKPSPYGPRFTQLPEEVAQVPWDSPHCPVSLVALIDRVVQGVMFALKSLLVSKDDNDQQLSTRQVDKRFDKSHNLAVLIDSIQVVFWKLDRDAQLRFSNVQLPELQHLAMQTVFASLPSGLEAKGDNESYDSDGSSIRWISAMKRLSSVINFYGSIDKMSKSLFSQQHFAPDEMPGIDISELRTTLVELTATLWTLILGQQWGHIKTCDNQDNSWNKMTSLHRSLHRSLYLLRELFQYAQPPFHPGRERVVSVTKLRTLARILRSTLDDMASDCAPWIMARHLYSEPVDLLTRSFECVGMLHDDYCDPAATAQSSMSKLRSELAGYPARFLQHFVSSLLKFSSEDKYLTRADSLLELKKRLAKVEMSVVGRPEKGRDTGAYGHCKLRSKAHEILSGDVHRQVISTISTRSLRLGSLVTYRFLLELALSISADDKHKGGLKDEVSKLLAEGKALMERKRVRPECKNWLVNVAADVGIVWKYE